MTQPIKKYKAGNIQGAIWFNEREVGEGVVGFKTVSLTRSWKDKKDVWRNEVLNLRKQDLPKIRVILQKIQEELLLTDFEKEAVENDEE